KKLGGSKTGGERVWVEAMSNGTALFDPSTPSSLSLTKYPVLLFDLYTGHFAASPFSNLHDKSFTPKPLAP
ncbi:MAG: hypothetical protein AAF958_08220, partial [Planctomycetota bacterium]